MGKRLLPQKKRSPTEMSSLQATTNIFAIISKRCIEQDDVRNPRQTFGRPTESQHPSQRVSDEDEFSGWETFRYLTGDEPESYAELAAQMATTAGGLRVAVHRLRRQFGDALRETIAETVERPDKIDDELRHLLEAVMA